MRPVASETSSSGVHASSCSARKPQAIFILGCESSHGFDPDLAVEESFDRVILPARYTAEAACFHSYPSATYAPIFTRTTASIAKSMALASTSLGKNARHRRLGQIRQTRALLLADEPRAPNSRPYRERPAFFDGVETCSNTARHSRARFAANGSRSIFPTPMRSPNPHMLVHNSWSRLSSTRGFPQRRAADGALEMLHALGSDDTEARLRAYPTRVFRRHEPTFLSCLFGS